MKKLVFATNNKHKLAEVRAILKDTYQILSLEDINCHEDIPETADNLEDNARQKAHYIYEHYHVDCFADDSGLEVKVLGGAPGVYSARFAALEGTGKAHDSKANTNRLLRELKDKSDRSAQFRTIICLYLNGQEILFEGIVKGKINQQEQGSAGFGYDPVFIPSGYNKTFAELGEDIKNTISHRALATKKLVNYLKSQLC
ncbi:MAG: non-canonical purine NTP diphosphatase [Bacteroidaceae bacterium]|nr:non-canonical purine NTP diphosphatase [Bacteroidaceae bacterium]